MRSNGLAKAGIAALLIGGLAVAGYLFVTGGGDGPGPVRVQVSDLPDYSPLPDRQALPPVSQQRAATNDAGEEADQPLQARRESRGAELVREARERSGQDVLTSRTEQFNVILSGRVSDEHGRGIEGATVSVRLMGPGQPVARAGARPGVRVAGEAAGEATSDAAGNFRVEAQTTVITGAQTVDALVSAAATGFVSHEPVHVQGFRRGEERTGITVVVGIAGGLTGRVTDAMGAPLSGVLVSAVRPRRPQVPETDDAIEAEGALRSRMGSRVGRPLPEQGGSAMTDELGAWRIEALAPGNWFVSAALDAFVPYVDETPVQVVAGVETFVADIRLRPSTSLRLRVLSAEGEPVQGHMRGDITRQGGGSATVGGLADADGNVVFRNVPADALQLVIRSTALRVTGPVPLSLIEGQENDGGEIRMLPLNR